MHNAFISLPETLAASRSSQDDVGLVMAHMGLAKLNSHSVMDVLVDINKRASWDPVFNSTRCIEERGSVIFDTHEILLQAMIAH